MYLLRSGSSSFLLRTKTGPWSMPWRRRVRRVPSNPHGRATSEMAAGGTSTCAKSAPSGRRERLYFYVSYETPFSR